MMQPPDVRRFARAALAAAALLAGCGGTDLAGVDSGGTGSYAVGPISGFGSVIVNGIRYDDAQSVVLDEDGRVRSAADLKLGMVVEVEGSLLSAAPAGARYQQAGRADAIRFGAGIVGPLQSVDAPAMRLTVFGQVVEVTASTVFGDGLAGGLGALAALPRGVVLEVDGYTGPAPAGAAAAGRTIATRIDRRTSGDAFRLHGTVRELDSAARRFRLGDTRIDYAALGVDEVAAAGIASGAVVRLRIGAVQGADGSWPIERARSGVRALPDRDDADIEGVVTAVTGPTAFSVNGVPVDASRANFVGDRSRLVPGARVEVEGRLRGGVLVADEVELEGTDGSSSPGGAGAPGDILLSGPIESVDPVTRSFRLRGVTVNHAAASFDDGTAADLRVGTRVEVDGRLSADGATVDAVGIEFDD